MLKQNCSDFLCPQNLCWHLFSKYFCMYPFLGKRGKRNLVQNAQLLLTVAAHFCVCCSSDEGPYDLCEVPLLLPDSLWGITRLLIIWVAGPNPPLCGTSGLLVKKAVSFISLTSPAMFSYLFPSCFANAGVHADTWRDRLGSWSSWKLTHFSEGVGKDLFGDCLLAQRRNRNEGKGKRLPLLQQPVLMLD